LLKRLESMGLVLRKRSRPDERHVEVTLTESGRALRQQAETVPEAVLCASQCSPEELVHLRDELHALRARLAKAD
jgi:DNA-binding MarR family transcriptional regulator